MEAYYYCLIFIPKMDYIFVFLHLYIFINPRAMDSVQGEP